MDSNVCWREEEESRLMREDEARMQELKRLFDLMDEREKAEQKAVDEYLRDTANEILELETSLRILSWIDIAESLSHCVGRCEEPVDYIEVHRKWLKALRSAMSYLAKVLLVTDASLLIKLRRTLDRYAEISYPNLLIVIQPKLQTLNSIKA